MKKILILGSSGQLGTDIKAQLDGFELFTLSRDHFVAGRDNLAFLPEDVEYVINCIAYHRTDEVEDYPYEAFNVNTSFVSDLARWCSDRRAILFHFSTDYVFDGVKRNPYLEIDQPNPINLYGLSKYSGELAISMFLDRYFIFRISSLFGRAGSVAKGGNFVETMIALAKKGGDIQVVADQYMVPTHTLDVAKAVRYFIEEGVDEYGIYHCCSRGSCSWFEFAEGIFERIGIIASLEAVSSDQYKMKALRPKYSVLDNRKIERYYRMPYWKDALDEYLRITNHI